MVLGLLSHGLAVRISREDDTDFLQREVMDTNQQLTQLETYNKVEKQIKEALKLDNNERPGLKRGTGAPIVVQKTKQENEKERSVMVDTPIMWGWQDPMITYKRRH